MLYGISIICLLGAAIRFVFYRLIGKKSITMKYLMSKEDEQQMTSLAFGIIAIMIIAFAVFQL